MRAQLARFLSWTKLVVGYHILSIIANRVGTGDFNHLPEIFDNVVTEGLQTAKTGKLKDRVPVGQLEEFFGQLPLQFLFGWVFDHGDSKLSVYTGQQVNPEVSVPLLEMMRVLPNNVVPGIKRHRQTRVVNDVRYAVNIVFWLPFVEDNFQCGILVGNSLDSQCSVDTDKCARNCNIVGDVQRNHGVVINQILLSDHQVSSHPIINVPLALQTLEEVSLEPSVLVLQHHYLLMIEGVVLFYHSPWSKVSHILLGLNRDDLLALFNLAF